MATILLGNQWGRGVGHVRNLRALADRLQQMGQQPVLALPDLVAARPAIEDVNYTIIQGPVWRGALRPRKQTRTFSDILANQAFADEKVFATLAKGWHTLIDLVKPDQVIVEYAPILSMAAQGRIPVAAVGSPFCLPPSHCDSFPVLNDEAGPAFPEEKLLGLINDWLGKHNGVSLPALPAIHPPDHSYPIGLVEMDPYRNDRPEQILSPLPDSLPSPLPAGMPEGPPRLFCYLMAHHKPSIQLITILAQGGIHIECYIKEAGPPMIKRLGELGISVHRQHVPIREALERAHLLLHNGSTILSYEALAMGRAQLCFPMDLEKELNSRNLQALGVAKIVRRPDVQPKAVDSVRQLAFDAVFHDKARAFAQDLAGRAFDDPIEVIIDKLGY